MTPHDTFTAYLNSDRKKPLRFPIFHYFDIWGFYRVEVPPPVFILRYLGLAQFTGSSKHSDGVNNSVDCLSPLWLWCTWLTHFFLKSASCVSSLEAVGHKWKTIISSRDAASCRMTTFLFYRWEVLAIQRRKVRSDSFCIEIHYQ